MRRREGRAKVQLALPALPASACSWQVLFSGPGAHPWVAGGMGRGQEPPRRPDSGGTHWVVLQPDSVGEVQGFLPFGDWASSPLLLLTPGSQPLTPVPCYVLCVRC